MDTIIPTRLIGPLSLIGDLMGSFSIPLATYETPLWYSVQRGAKVTSNGIRVTLLKESMTRSIICEASSAARAKQVLSELVQFKQKLQTIISVKSKHLSLLEWHGEIVGKLLFLRFSFDVSGAAGHNMVTQGAQDIQNWMLTHFSLKYVSISGNYCVDKKNSAINGILGRGRHVVAETYLDNETCVKKLKINPEQLVALNVKKNLIGSILSGGVRSANAHYANMLLAFYLAMGQDGANVVEGSQGITYLEQQKGGVYFSVNIPSIIVGSVGNGKNLPHVQAYFKKLGCFNQDPLHNSRCLAYLAAAVVLCGELSLLVSQTIPNQLVRSHLLLERKKQAHKP